MIAGVDLYIDPHLATPAPWSAVAYSIADWSPPRPLYLGLPLLAPMRPMLIVEPGFFALGAALNLAAAHRPDGVP